MRVAVFSARPFDRDHLTPAAARAGHELAWFEARLTADTAILARGCPAVCAFVNDDLSRPTLEALATGGCRLIALRSAGFSHVDVRAASELGLAVCRVPAYSPHAVAEHTVALILALARKIHRAYGRVRDGNFALDGLCGFDLHGRTVGIVGFGTIGRVFARIMAGFGCHVIASDPAPPAPGDEAIDRVELDDLFARADIISLHCPLTPATRHIIDARAIARMKRGVMLINTGRGALVDTRAVIAGLKSGHIGHLGVDVYEEEEALFFADHSADIIHDDVFVRLVTFPNVIVTAHQAFLTTEALANIAETTMANVSAFAAGRPQNVVG